MTTFRFEAEDHGLQYLGGRRIDGPLVVVEGVRDVGFDEVVEIIDAAGRASVRSELAEEAADYAEETSELGEGAGVGVVPTSRLATVRDDARHRRDIF